MSSFLVTSLVASVLLTLALNLLPALFPNAAAKAESKLRDSIERLRRAMAATAAELGRFRNS